MVIVRMSANHDIQMQRAVLRQRFCKANAALAAIDKNRAP